MRAGSATEPSPRDVRRDAGVDRVAQLVALARASSAPPRRRGRPRASSVVPPVVEARRAAKVKSSALDLDLGEAGLVEQLLDPRPASREREHPRRRRLGRRRSPGRARASSSRATAAHGLSLGGVPHGERDPPARAAARAASRAAPPRGRRAACSPSGTGPRRRVAVGEVDPLGVHRAELDVRRSPSSSARARARVDHRLGRVGDDHASRRARRARRRAGPCRPSPAASSSTGLAGLRGDRARPSSCDTGAATRWQRLAARAQPAAARLPALAAARLAVGARRPCRVNARARGAAACPTASAAASSANAIALGTLNGASAARQWPRSSSSSVAAPARRTTVATTASPHSRPRGRATRRLRDRRMRLEHRLDLGRRDVLAAA